MFIRQKLFFGFALIALILALVPIGSASAKSFVFNRNLSFGSIGQDVKELQKFLNNHGFALALSGFGSSGQETTFFGRLTKASLIKFQQSNRIYPAWGYFGPITRAFINEKHLAETNSGAPDPTSSVPETQGDSSTPYYAVGGTITGLSGTLVLQNNNGDDLIINPGDDSVFSFSKKLSDGSAYLVTVKPDAKNHRCYFQNNAGIIRGAAVTDIKIACGTSLFFNPFTFIFSNSGAVDTFVCGEDLVDTRDSQSYSTALIGSQCWMTENLNIGTRVNGLANQANANGGTMEKYCYDDDPAKCLSDGALYQWHTAMAFAQECSNHSNSGSCLVSHPRQGICPTGWHVPSLFELQTLAQNADPGCNINCDSGPCSCTSAGLKLKADPAHLPIAWDGTNLYGFSVIPSGIRSPDGSFSRYGVSTNLWTAVPLGGADTQYSWFTSFFGTGNIFAVPPDPIYGGLNFRTYGYSLRCVKD